MTRHEWQRLTRVDALDVLSALGPDGIFVNVARASVVDATALIKALQDGTIGAAGLDLFDGQPTPPPALAALDNLVLTPHIGGSTFDGRRLMGEAVVENVLRALHGEEPLFRVA